MNGMSGMSGMFGGQFVLCAGLLVPAWCGLAGCSPPPSPTAKPAAAAQDHGAHGHDHEGHEAVHDHGNSDEHRVEVDTLAAGLIELEKVTAAVKAALAERDLDDADGHVHMVGHLVDDLHRLVASAKLPAEAEGEAKKALDALFECFDAMDTKLHASDEEIKKSIEYAEHEERIEAALKTLKDIEARAGKAVGAAAAGFKDVDE